LEEAAHELRLDHEVAGLLLREHAEEAVADYTGQLRVLEEGHVVHEVARHVLSARRHRPVRHVLEYRFEVVRPDLVRQHWVRPPVVVLDQQARAERHRRLRLVLLPSLERVRRVVADGLLEGIAVRHHKRQFLLLLEGGRHSALPEAGLPRAAHVVLGRQHARVGRARRIILGCVHG
jgi:hypothetical protein